MWVHWIVLFHLCFAHLSDKLWALLVLTEKYLAVLSAAGGEHQAPGLQEGLVSQCCFSAAQFLGQDLPGWNLPCRQVQWDCCFLIPCPCFLPGMALLWGLSWPSSQLEDCAKTADKAVSGFQLPKANRPGETCGKVELFCEQVSRNGVSSYCNWIQYLAALGGLSEERRDHWYGGLQNLFL